MLTSHDGRLWFTTSQGGLGMIANPTAHQPHIAAFPAHLSTPGVGCLAEDGHGQIWAGSSKGLNRVNPNTHEVRYFTAAEGYPTGGCSVLRADSQGRLWVGTSMGLARYLPGSDAPDPTPAVYLTGLVTKREPSSSAAVLTGELGRFDYRQNYFRIDFSSPAAVEGRAIRYRYRLEGTSRDWSKPGDQRSVEYPDLPPGKYRFLALAVDEGGHESPAPAELRFEILPPFWQRWWFVVLCAAAIATAIHKLYRFQLSKQLALERLRSHIAADLHDDLGASLSRVAIMSELVRHRLEQHPAESREKLGEIADAARNMVDGLSDLVWSIDPRKDDMRSVLRRVREYASDVLESQGIDWTLDADARIEILPLDAAQRRHLYLILKEAINNAARHSHCRLVRLSVRLEGKQCVVEVADDGQGLLAANGVVEAGGNGLGNIQERAGELGGVLTIVNSPGLRLLLRFPVSGA